MREYIEELFLLSSVSNSLLNPVIHSWFFLHPHETAAFLSKTWVEILYLLNTVGGALPFGNVRFFYQATVIDLAAQISADHHRHVIHWNLRRSCVVMPKLSVFKTFRIECLGMFVARKILHILHGRLPYSVHIERIPILLLLFLLPKLFRHVSWG